MPVKSLLPRAGLWVVLMHVTAWTVIAAESLGMPTVSGTLHLPPLVLLERSWMTYCVAWGGLIVLLSAVFMLSLRPTFRAVWNLTPTTDHSLFRSELKFNAIGLTVLVAISLASISANKWAFSNLSRLQGSEFLVIELANHRTRLSTAQYNAIYGPGQLQKEITKDIQEAGPDSPPAFFRGDFSRLNRSVKHRIFPLHVVFMTLLYMAFCRALTIRHRVMVGAWR